MKILLHVGLAKTGTTALQDSLIANREVLAKAGVLYPFWRASNSSHLWASWLGKTLDEGDLQNWMAPHFGGLNQIRNLAAEAFAALEAEVAEKKPDLLILSSEQISTRAVARRLDAIRDKLASLSTEIDVVLYVREPVATYLSTLQEDAKLNDRPPQSSNQWLREKLDGFSAAFPGRLTVLPYDRSQLTGGDIVRDVATRFLTQYLNPSSLVSRISNESLSAEAAIINVRYRSAFIPEKNGIIDSDAAKLLRDIRSADAGLPGRRRIALRAGLARQLRRSAVDYVWLRDRYGVTFAELPYQEIDGTPPEIFANRDASYNDLLDVDQDRVAAIVGKLQEVYPADSVVGRRLAEISGKPMQDPSGGPVHDQPVRQLQPFEFGKHWRALRRALRKLTR